MSKKQNEPKAVNETDAPAAPAAPAAKPAASGYAVQWNIKTGGKRYGPGDAVELDDEAAAPFLASGAIAKA